MKYVKTKSVIPAIRILLNIAWFWGIVFVAILLVMVFYQADFVKNNLKRSIALNFNINGESLSKLTSNDSIFSKNILKSNDPSFTDAIVKTDNLHLSFCTNDFTFMIFFVLYYAIYFAAYFMILYYLKKIFSNLPEVSPFNYQNYKRIRLIAVLIIVFPFVHWIFNTVLNVLLSSKYDVRMMLNIDLTSALIYILLGLIILAISEIFNQGIKLKEEQDLTV